MSGRCRADRWTAAEDARVDKCIEYGVGPRAALRFFPTRTEQGLHNRFARRRAVLGIPGVFGRPPKPSEIAASVRKLAQAFARPVKFEVSTALAPPPKARTAETPEGIASRALLRRQLETGKHWISSPEQFAAACASVGLRP